MGRLNPNRNQLAVILVLVPNKISTQKMKAPWLS